MCCFIYNAEFEKNTLSITLYVFIFHLELELRVLYFKFCSFIHRVQEKSVGLAQVFVETIFSIHKERGQNNSELIYNRGWRFSVRMLYLGYCTYAKPQSALIGPCIYCYR